MNPKRCERRRLLRLAGGLVLVLAAGMARPAGAHTTLTSTTPAAHTVLAAAPSTVRFRFSGPVTVAKGGARLVAVTGTRTLPATVDRPGRTVSLQLPALLPGAYIATVAVTSADGHALAHATSFGVRGRARAKAGAAPTLTATLTADGARASVTLAPTGDPDRYRCEITVVGANGAPVDARELTLRFTHPALGAAALVTTPARSSAGRARCAGVVVPRLAGWSVELLVRTSEFDVTSLAGPLLAR